jgi:hypothetical protein
MDRIFLLSLESLAWMSLACLQKVFPIHAVVLSSSTRNDGLLSLDVAVAFGVCFQHTTFDKI